MAARNLYLNHAGTSWPKPGVVTKAVRDAMLATPADWPQRFDEAYRAVAEFFGVSRAEQILLTPGCTSALTVAISDVLLKSGRRVLTSPWEHHALHRPLLKLAATGVPLEYIPPGTPDAIDLDWLEKELSKNDVGLVAITAACNVSGELLPYEEVIQISHRYGATVLIDAAQIVGWLQLDLPALGADMVAFGGHKGLQSPWGIGGLYLSDGLQMQCITASCELPGEAESNPRQQARPGYCDVGSVDQFALAGLHAAIRMLAGQDMEANLVEARSKIQRLRRALDGIDGLRLYGPIAPEQRMPSLAFTVSGCSSGEFAAQASRHGLVVGSGIHCAPLAHQTLHTQGAGLVRLSVGLGQPDDEIDEAIERLTSVIDEKSVI